MSEIEPRPDPSGEGYTQSANRAKTAEEAITRTYEVFRVDIRLFQRATKAVQRVYT